MSAAKGGTAGGGSKGYGPLTVESVDSDGVGSVGETATMLAPAGTAGARHPPPAAAAPQRANYRAVVAVSAALNVFLFAWILARSTALPPPAAPATVAYSPPVHSPVPALAPGTVPTYAPLPQLVPASAPVPAPVFVQVDNSGAALPLPLRVPPW